MEGFRLIWLLSALALMIVVVVVLPAGADASEENEEDDQLANSTRWAVLVAGSKGYINYRHQANVCHAYQILKKGGLKDENIIVFMYDDIAMNETNPRPGIIINHPEGEDVYAGVPKDYTGENTTMDNLYAVLLGDKSAVKGGSGKVLDTKPNDRIFFYYTDHGGAGLLGMPDKPWIVASDLIDVLKKKHAMGTYKEMVMYVEACESGSIFEGLLPEDMNIYVVTSSDTEESSYFLYCPGDPVFPAGYTVCLGDQFSAAWMEDSETHNLKKETLEEQFKKVKERTSNYSSYYNGSHVMEYGDKSIKHQKIYLYQGYNPESANFPDNRVHVEKMKHGVSQRDADLVFFWEEYKKSSRSKRAEVLNMITETLRHREHLANIIDLIGVSLFGPQNGSSILLSVRGRGLPLVDDWDCFKSTIRLFEKHCGFLTQNSMKHSRAFANICNNMVEKTRIEKVFTATCSGNSMIEQYVSSGGVYSV